MARKDWNIRGIFFYVDDNDNMFDIYDYSEKISEDIPISYIASMLRLSKQRFIDVLNEPCDSKRHLITSYEEEFREGRYTFNRYNVFSFESDLTVELLDFEDWLDDNYHLLKENLAVPNEYNDIASCEKQLATKDKELFTIKSELEQVRQEKVDLQAELEKAKEEHRQGMTSQQKASRTRSENSLAAWKPVMATMIEIAVTIGKEGPKERQTPDLYVYFNERDVILSSEQMKFFRRALPPAYKDTKGGAVGKI